MRSDRNRINFVGGDIHNIRLDDARLTYYFCYKCGEYVLPEEVDNHLCSPVVSESSESSDTSDF